MLFNIDQFRQQGFAVLPSVFTSTDLQNFRCTLQNMITVLLQRSKLASTGNLDQDIRALVQQDPQCLSFMQATISRSPEFFYLTGQPAITQTVRHCLQLNAEAPMYLISNGVVFNCRGKHQTNFQLGWHNDIFFTLPKSPFVQIWAPLLHTADEEIGSLRVCPGSHLAEKTQQRVHPNNPFNLRYSVPDSEVAKYQIKSVQMDCGDVLLFDGRLIHSSGFNQSDKLRVTLLGLYHHVGHPHFLPVRTSYRFQRQTPEQYFYEVFGDEKIAPLLTEQLAS